MIQRRKKKTLDRDLTELYHVGTKQLKPQRKTSCLKISRPASICSTPTLRGHGSVFDATMKNRQFQNRHI